jgi:hypothetical protein
VLGFWVSAISVEVVSGDLWWTGAFSAVLFGSSVGLVLVVVDRRLYCAVGRVLCLADLVDLV